MDGIVTTANPGWFNAKEPCDLIPDAVDADGNGLRMVNKAGLFLITQGPHAGRRFREVMLPWQAKVIRKTFGDGVQELCLKVGKGSGKTTMVAAITLACVMDWALRGVNTRAHVVAVAANVASADILAQHVIEAVALDEHLRGAFRTYVANRELIHKASGITLKIIPPDLSRAVGLRPALVVTDEIHAAADESKEFAAVVDQLRRGGMNWPDFLLIGITTAPTRRGKGYYQEWLNRARAVRDGRIVNPRLLPVLFEFPAVERPDLKVDDVAEWWRGMPSLITANNPLGTMHVDALLTELDEAVKDADINGSGKMELLLSQRLGIELTERGGGITPLSEYWGRQTVAVFPSDIGATVAVAMDPSSGIDDPFAVVITFSLNNVHYCRSYQWLTQEGYKRGNEHMRMVYDKAIASGELSLCSNDLEIQTEVFALCKSLQLRQPMGIMCGGDAAGLVGFTQRFEREVTSFYPIKQGWTLYASFEATIGMLHGGRLLHLGQPLLTENIHNLRNEGNRFYKDDGRASGQGFCKIDGAMALLSSIELLATKKVFDVSTMIG